MRLQARRSSISRRQLVTFYDAFFDYGRHASLTETNPESLSGSPVDSQRAILVVLQRLNQFNEIAAWLADRSALGSLRRLI